MKYPSNRIPEFDLLRALSMLYVISVWHIYDYTNLVKSFILYTIALSVVGFFVYMSGFLLSKKYDSITGLEDIKNFITKRLFRIYPLYLVALILFLLTSQISLKGFFSALCFLNIIFDIRIITLWFISMIFIFYLLVPIIFYKYSIKRTIFICFLFVTICIFLRKYFHLIDLRLLYFFPSFIFGLLSAKYDALRKYMKNRILITICIGAVAIATYIHSAFVFPWCKHIVWITCTFMSIAPLNIFGLFLVSRINQRLIIKLSYASYCMYIFHRIIFWCLIKIYIPPTNLLTILYLECIGLPILYHISQFIQSKYDYIYLKINNLQEYLAVTECH